MKSIKTVYKIGHGPSSSHTMGPGFAAEKIKALYPDHAYEVTLYNSLALTGKGHLTDYIIKDILGEVVFKHAIDLNKHPNLLTFRVQKDGISKEVEVVSIGGGEIIFDGKQDVYEEVYKEKNFNEIKAYCETHNISLIEFIQKREPEDTFDYLKVVWEQMKDTIKKGKHTTGVLPGDLKVVRKANTLYEKANSFDNEAFKNKTLLSAYAFSSSEENAAGGMMVTSPTCGASGVMPAVLYYAYEVEKVSEDIIIEALAIGGIFGNIIRKNASISGAVAGCQAEIGSACSMAAAAYSHIKGLSLDQIEYAAEIAMEHHLGLTCDPVGGYVQIPCIERNAVAATRAINASELSLVLYETRKISFDMIVETMYQTGLDMDPKYKETAEAGLASFYRELEKWKKE